MDGISFALKDNSYLTDNSFYVRVFNATKLEIENLTI